MDATSIINVISIVVEIISVLVGIIALILSSKDDSSKISITYIEYKEEITNIKEKRNGYSNNVSTSSDSGILILYALCSLLIFTVSIVFHNAISTILSIISSIYLFRVLLFVKKERIPFSQSRTLIIRSIAYVVLALSTYIFDSDLKNIEKEFPDVSPIINGSTYLVDWLGSSFKIVINRFTDLTNARSSFPYFYILFRTAGIAYLIIYLLDSIKRKRILKQIYRYDIYPLKSVSCSVFQMISISLLLHINIIYFSVLARGFDILSTWANN